MADLDGGQGFRVYDGWGVQAMYIRNGYNHLITSSGAASNGGQYREVRGREGEATTNSDVWGWWYRPFQWFIYDELACARYVVHNDRTTKRILCFHIAIRWYLRTKPRPGKTGR